MITWIKSFLFDESVFERSIRTVIAMLGAGMQAGVVPTGIGGGGKYGAFITALAFFIGAGQKNPK